MAAARTARSADTTADQPPDEATGCGGRTGGAETADAGICIVGWAS